MSQNREAPAYQEYAANILAQLPFRVMTLKERGLFYTMRLECWVNRRLPNDHGDLAKILGVPVADIAASLPAVMPFFMVVDGYITSPEHDAYRAHLEDRREKQSRGGKRGSTITNGKRYGPAKAADSGGASTPSSNSQVPRRAPRRGRVDSLVQSNAEQQSQNQPPVDVSEYEAVEGRVDNDYAKASRGE